MDNVCIIGQGFVGALMSVACARVKKRGKPLYNVFGLEKNNNNGNSIISKLNSGIFPYISNDSFLKKRI